MAMDVDITSPEAGESGDLPLPSVERPDGAIVLVLSIAFPSARIPPYPLGCAPNPLHSYPKGSALPALHRQALPLH